MKQGRRNLDDAPHALQSRATPCSAHIETTSLSLESGVKSKKLFLTFGLQTPRL